MQVNVRIAFVMLDVVAKAGIVNHMQFNGKFGYPQCFIRGKTAQKNIVWIYRYG